MIHTTIGIYLNGDYKINGVSSVNLKNHIVYNTTIRFGRALIVDGEIVYCGYWKKKDLEEFLVKNKINEINVDKDTFPYV